MRRGLTISGLIHFFLLLLLWIKLPSLDFAPPPVVNVKLMSSTQAEQATVNKKEPTPPLRTQQSSAPKEAPKPQEVKAEAPKHATKMVKEKVEEKKQKVQPYPQASSADGTTEEELRPEKLDKTPNKKDLVNDKNAKLREVTEKDFSAALDFLNALEAEKTQLPATNSSDSAVVMDVDAFEVDKIRKHIERNWFRPTGIQNLDKLSIIVEVQVDRDGTVTGIEVSQSSGQPFFDASLIRAVKKASPIPIPANKYDTYRKLELRFNG